MGHASDLVGRRSRPPPARWSATRSTPPRSPRASGGARRASPRCAWRPSPRRGARCWCARCRCGRGATGGRAGARPRRHRPAPPRHGAAVQGRHDPRDPPPGEEQPADRRGAAAPAGRGARASRRPRRRWRRACAGSTSIALVHETLSASVAERVDLDEVVDKVIPAIGDGGAPPRRAPRCAATAASARCPPSSRRRSCWCSPSSCTTRSRTRTPRASAARSWCTARRSAQRWT